MIVSRARHHREIAALERLVAVAEHGREDARQDALDAMRLHEMERRRYDELLQQFMALKVKGAEVIPVAGGVVEPAPAEPAKPADPALALIDELCGRDIAKRKMMLRQLAADRTRGLSDDAIAAAILTGVPPEGVP